MRPIGGKGVFGGSANTGSSSASVGDVKQGLQVEDHAGWYSLNGRHVDTLPSVAKSAAATIGFTFTLPNANDKVLRATTNPQLVGNYGGDNKIKRVQLPDDALQFSGNTGNNNRGHSHKVDPPNTSTTSSGAAHSHDIAAMLVRATDTYATGDNDGPQVPISRNTWSYDWGSDQGGSGRTYAYIGGSKTIESDRLIHGHNVAIPEHSTGSGSSNHWHSVDIAEFDSGTQSQNHQHPFSGSTESMNGTGAQEEFFPSFMYVNTFIYLGE